MTKTKRIKLLKAAISTGLLSIIDTKYCEKEIAKLDALLMCSKNKWKSIKVKVKYIAKAVVYARYRYFSDCDFIEIIPQS